MARTTGRTAWRRLGSITLGGDGASGRQRLGPDAGGGALRHGRRRHRTRRPRVPRAVAERGAGALGKEAADKPKISV